MVNYYRTVLGTLLVTNNTGQYYVGYLNLEELQTLQLFSIVPVKKQEKKKGLTCYVFCVFQNIGSDLFLMFVFFKKSRKRSLKKNPCQNILFIYKL